MVRTAPTIILQSVMNPEMDVVITPYLTDLDMILSIEADAYRLFWNWFDDETTDKPIGDYICDGLARQGFVRGLNFDMYFGADWEKDDGKS